MFGILRKKERLIRTNTLPPQEWLSAASEPLKFSPDYSRLERYEYQLLFVCDELQRGHRLNPALGDQAMFGATAFTKDKFTLWKKRLGRWSSATVIDRGYHDVMSSRVKGEIFAVRPWDLKNLDTIKENGYHYARRRIILDVPYRQVYWQKDGPGGGGVHVTQSKVQQVKAWAYVGLPEYWDDQIDSGLLFKPVGLFFPRKEYEEPYYCFTSQEYYKDTEGIQSRLR